MVCPIDAPSLFDAPEAYHPGGGKQNPVHRAPRRDAGETGKVVKPPAHPDAPHRPVRRGGRPCTVEPRGACRSTAANPALVSPLVHSSRRARGHQPWHDQARGDGTTPYTVTGSAAPAEPVRYAAQQERLHADERKRPQTTQMGLGVPKQRGSEHAAFPCWANQRHAGRQSICVFCVPVLLCRQPHRTAPGARITGARQDPMPSRAARPVGNRPAATGTTPRPVLPAAPQACLTTKAQSEEPPRPAKAPGRSRTRIGPQPVRESSFVPSCLRGETCLPARPDVAAGRPDVQPKRSPARHTPPGAPEPHTPWQCRGTRASLRPARVRLPSPPNDLPRNHCGL